MTRTTGGRRRDHPGLLLATGSVRGAQVDVPHDAARLFAAVREELLRGPPATLVLLELEDTSVTLHPRELHGPLTVRELHGTIGGLRTRPAPSGQLPTSAALTGTAGDKSQVRLRLRGDLLDATPELELRTVASRVPLRLASKAAREQAGLEVEGGTADVGLRATLRDGAYEGVLRTRFASRPEREHEGKGLLGELEEQLVEAAAPEGAGRTVHFSGDVEPADAPLPEALQQLVLAALRELTEGLVGKQG